MTTFIDLLEFLFLVAGFLGIIAGFAYVMDKIGG